MITSKLTNKKILYAALDWGFGHVTRSIGIINELIEKQNDITIACNTEQKELFKSYFSNVKFEFLEGYELNFSGKGNWKSDLIKNRKKFRNSIHFENHFVSNYIKNSNIDLIISDHRYGFFSNNIPSIFITHQLHLPVNLFFFLVQKWHEKQLRKFSTIWVLDEKENRLAGKLSQEINHRNLIYIGWKSRFSAINKIHELLYDYLIVISGPKPYSEQFLDEIVSKIDFTNKKVAVLHPKTIRYSSTKFQFNFFPANDLKLNDNLFFQSNVIISRSGYSTLMDLKILNKKAILFPTKGQKEQEYLYKISHDYSKV